MDRTISPTNSNSPSQKTSSDSFEDVPNDHSLFVDEDHFSVHSDIEFLDDVENRSVYYFLFILFYVFTIFIEQIDHE